VASRLPALNSRVLTVVLVVGLPVLVIGAAIVVSIGQARLRGWQTERLVNGAEYTSGAVDAYVYRRILDAALLGRVPDVRRAAAEGSSRPYDASSTAAQDRQWQADRVATAARSGVLSSPASLFLADLVRHDSVYREVLVTDRYGRLVAASNVTSDFFQADEDWWIQAFDNGRWRVSVSDVRRDESAGVYAFEIAVPVPAPSGDEVAGIMKIVADSREMLTGVTGLELGDTGEAALVRPDGSIVYSRQAQREGDPFFAAQLLRQRLDLREVRKEAPGPLTFVAQAGDGSYRVVALAPSQLGRSFPNLNWLVALSIDQNELLTPFRSLVWYLILVFALTAIAVLAIALWLSMRLAAPSVDPATDMHLVEHSRIPGTGDAR
jgi:hypothetical protein